MLGRTMLHRTSVLLSIAASLSLAACSRAPEAAPAPEAAATSAVPQRSSASDVTPLEQKKFGAAITEKNTTPLATLIKESDKYVAQIVRTEGKVAAVCKSAGCWMEITDESGQAHVKMAGHSFFVPKNASGHRAVVQGKVLKVEGGPKDHCTEEAEQQTGRVAKVHFEATGVEFVD